MDDSTAISSDLAVRANELKAANPRLKWYEIALQLGVSERTLRRARDESPKQLPSQYLDAGLTKVPFRGDAVLMIKTNGKPHVILKPVFDHIGLDSDWQIRKIQKQPWAVTGVTTATGQDGKRYQMITADVRTFLMALALVPASRVNEAARHLLIAYQSEVADVIESYWTQGAAINPRATEEQLDKTQKIIDSLRAARLAERADWRMFTDVIAAAADYRSMDPQRTRYLFANLRNDVHRVITGHTAKELIQWREIVQWPGKPKGKDPRKSDTENGLNYLRVPELNDEAFLAMCALVEIRKIDRRYGQYTVHDCVRAIHGVIAEMRETLEMSRLLA